MRKYGISDIFYLMFFILFVTMMFYGLSVLLQISLYSPSYIVNELGKNISLFYFYYPDVFDFPQGIVFILIPFLKFYFSVIVLIIIYIIIVVYIISSYLKGIGKDPLDNPVGFILGGSSFAYTLSIILIVLYFFSSISISAPAIEQAELTQPVLIFYQLVYAPIIEELEFRIIPIGIYLLIRYYLRGDLARYKEKNGINSGIMSKLVYTLPFMNPGKLKKFTGKGFDYIDYAIIIITSFLFGFAHYAYGQWSISKIPQAAIGGVIFAFGFMLFGPYVDIPMHYFFDGIDTVFLLQGQGFLSLFSLLFILLVLLGSVPFIITLYSRFKKIRTRKAIQSDELKS
ncbi:CPBP family glutamic-type intramembrane protease [Caldiplasma sukawensis]